MSRTEIPEWAAHILALRQRLHLSQTSLGQRLRCSAMTVSRWERGVAAPSAEHYIQLGSLASKTDCLFYWRRAGLRTSDLSRVVPERPFRFRPSNCPELQLVIAGSGGKVPKTQLVAIPLLKVQAGTHGEVGDHLAELEKAAVEEMIAAPSRWCPNPTYTKCLRVKGHSMMPLIHDGHIVAVDSSQTDISQLDGKIVVAWHEQRGLCISRFRRYGDVSVLEPENREYRAVVLKTIDDGWRIVARVLWWIGGAS